MRVGQPLRMALPSGLSATRTDPVLYALAYLLYGAVVLAVGRRLAGRIVYPDA